MEQEASNQIKRLALVQRHENQFAFVVGEYELNKTNKCWCSRKQQIIKNDMQPVAKFSQLSISFQWIPTFLLRFMSSILALSCLILFMVMEFSRLCRVAAPLSPSSSSAHTLYTALPLKECESHRTRLVIQLQRHSECAVQWPSSFKHLTRRK